MKRASVSGLPKKLNWNAFCRYESVPRSVLVSVLERLPVPKVGQFLFLGQGYFEA